MPIYRFKCHANRQKILNIYICIILNSTIVQLLVNFLVIYNICLQYLFILIASKR